VPSEQCGFRSNVLIVQSESAFSTRLFRVRRLAGKYQIRSSHFLSATHGLGMHVQGKPNFRFLVSTEWQWLLLKRKRHRTLFQNLGIDYLAAHFFGSTPVQSGHTQLTVHLAVRQDGPN